MKKIIKKIPFISVLILITVFLLFVFIEAIQIRYDAKKMGETIGSVKGELAGTAVGSIEGALDIPESFEEGKTDGLSANDINSEVLDSIKGVGNLQVLVASVKLKDIQSIGDDYKAIYMLKGDVIFTEDLSKAEFSIDEDNSLEIKLEEPQMELFLNDSNMKKIAEYQKHYFTGSAEDGYNAFINTRDKIYENSKEAIANYDSLLENAKKAAINQIHILVNSIYDEDVILKISFKSEGEEKDE